MDRTEKDGDRYSYKYFPAHENPRNALTKEQKSFNNSKPTDVVSTGMTIQRIYGFSRAVSCVRHARHCDKMYSRHFVWYDQ